MKALEKRTLESTIAGGIQFILSFVQSILLVPFFLKFWGTEKYGLWIAVLSFVTMLRALDLGHQNFVGTEFQLSYHTDKKKARVILGSSVRIALLLGLLEIVIFSLLISFGLDRVIIGYDSLSAPSIRLGMFALVLMWWTVGSVGGILVRVILPLGFYARTVYLSLILKILEISVLLFCSLGNTSLFWVCFWYAVASFFYSVFIMWDISRIMPEIFPWWKGGNWKLGLSNLKKSLILTLNGSIDQFNINGIVLIISGFLETVTVPVFTTIRTVTNTLSQLTMLVTGPLVPELTRFHSTGQHEKTLHVFNTYWLISGLVVNLPMVVIVSIINPIYFWWTDGKLDFNTSLFFLLSLSVCLINYGRSYTNYLSGMNHVKAMFSISLSRFLVLSLSLALLLPLKGLIAFGWSILLSEVFASWIIPTLYINSILKEFKVFSSKKNEIFALAGIAIVACCYIFISYIPDIYTVWPVTISTLLIIALSYYQWSILDSAIKIRLLNLIGVY